MLRMRLKWRLQAAACLRCARSWLLVELAGAQFGQKVGFSIERLEAAHCHFEGFRFRGL